MTSLDDALAKARAELDRIEANALESLREMAGFQVSINGRFWVSTEDTTAGGGGH